MKVRLLPARVDDVDLIRWALFTALAWNPERARLVREVTLDHPQIARYHRYEPDVSAAVARCLCLRRHVGPSLAV